MLNRKFLLAAASAAFVPGALLAQDACSGWMSNCAAVELASESDDLVVYVPNAYTERSETPRRSAGQGLTQSERLYLEAIGAQLFEGAAGPPSVQMDGDAGDARGSARRSSRTGSASGLTVARLSYGYGCSPSSWFACVDLERSDGAAGAGIESDGASSRSAGTSAYFSFRLGHPVLTQWNRAERGRSGDRIPTTVTFRSPSDRDGPPRDRPGAGPSDSGDAAPRGPGDGDRRRAGPSDRGGSDGTNVPAAKPGSDAPGNSDAGSPGGGNGPTPTDLLPIPTDTPPMASVPEPISTTLVSLGLLGYAGVRARRRREERLVEDE